MNNAGTVIINGATKYSMEEYTTIMSNNVEAPYHLSQIAHPLLKASANATIVFVSSVAGLIALPNLSAYAASKGEIISIYYTFELNFFFFLVMISVS